MLRLFTIITFSLFISSTLSAEYVNKGCDKKGCTEYEWYNKGRFNPYTIHWPLHYTGEYYKDIADGGPHEIEIIYGGHYGSHSQHSLGYYRHQPECPDPHYLSKGIAMHPTFECVNEAYHKPAWKNSSCSDIYTSYEDQSVYVDGPACSKIIRQWTIIDWCTYKPNTYANTQQDRYVLVHDTYKDKSYFAYGRGKHDVEYDGWYTFKQVIKILDKYPPEMSSCDDVSIELQNNKCEAYVKLKNKIVDSGPCTGDKMTVELEIRDYDGYTVASKWFYAYHDKYFDTQIGYLDVGHYTVHWKFKDGCGNYNSCVQKIRIEDKSPPHLLCIQKLSTSISDRHGVGIWAKDFAHKVSGSCDPEDVSISFKEDEFVPSLTFDCDDDLGIQELIVYAIDGNGNSSSCKVELFVADHNACGEGMQVAGAVFNRNYKALENVNIEVVKGDEVLSSVMSNEKGYYNLRGIPTDKALTLIKPSMEDKSKDGLDAKDLLYLLRHITRAERFDHVLEFAAADINSDGHILLDDYWALAAIIYDLPNRDPELQAWKFFDAKMYEGGVRRASKLVVPIPVKFFKNRYDIMGIKVGDIDFSSLDNKKAKWRNTDKLSSSYSVTPTSEGFKYQFDMNRLNQLGAITLRLEHVTKDMITSISTMNNEIPYIAYEEDGDLVLQITAAEGLRGDIAVYLKSEVNVAKLTPGVKIQEEGTHKTVYVGWKLASELGKDNITVAPNPFDHNLLITYTAKVGGNASLEMINMNGQIMIAQDVNLELGVNQLPLNTADLASGIYLLRISTSEGVEVARVTKSRP